MYKICKHSIFLVLIALCAFNCEGRLSKKASLRKNIEAFKKSNEIALTTYVPKTYTEKLTDTLLTNGFRVKTKMFTNMEESLIAKGKDNNITRNISHRLIETNIEVLYKDRIVYGNVINNSFIQDHFKTEKSVIRDFNLVDIWVNQSESLDKNLLSLQLDFRSISTNAHKAFKLLVNQEGEIYLTKLNTTNS